MLIYLGLDVSDFGKEDADFIIELFSSLGEVITLPEEKLNAVTGISGSGPAYVYLFIDGLIKAGVKQGLTEEESKLLAINTVIGSAQMLLKNPDKKPDELVKAVCSKGGTTIQAVEVFNDRKLEEIIDLAVDACVKRAKELENL